LLYPFSKFVSAWPNFLLTDGLDFFCIVQKGADTDVTNKEGKKPIDLALDGMDEEDIEESDVIAALKAKA
jgi:hypothetical protein